MSEAVQKIKAQLDENDLKRAHNDRQMADIFLDWAKIFQLRSEILLDRARLKERYRSVHLRERKGLLQLPEAKIHPADPSSHPTPRKNPRLKSPTLIDQCRNLLLEHPNGLTAKKITDLLKRQISVSGTMSRGVKAGLWVRIGITYLLKKNVPTQ